jgi:hypothetical protein
MRSSIARWFPLLALFAILALATVVRLHKIDYPLADWHSWRQADTASVAFEYTQPSLAPLSALLSPKYHDLSNIPSGKENPEGHRMVEFPIINYLVATIVSVVPSLDPTTDLVWVYRLFNTALSVLTIAVVYALVLITSKQNRVALLTALVMAVLPYSIFYSRTILPEIALNFFNFASLLTFLLWLETQGTNKSNSKKTKNYTAFLWLAATWLLLALAFLIKPMAVFMAPAFAAVAFWKLGFWKTLINWQIWLLATSIFPLFWWRTHIQQFPEGIPANKWLLNGNGIRFRPAWFRWLFGERIGLQILGTWATGFAILGLLSKTKSKITQKMNLFDWITISLSFGWLLYLAVFATGNVQHDYYQILLIPIVSILVAKGAIFFFDIITREYSKYIAFPAISALLLLATFLSWYQIKGYFNINNPAIVEAGIAVQENTPRSAKVIAPYMGDTAFLFQTQRLGWPIGHGIDERITMGATHYVSTSYDDEARELEEKYTVIKKTDTYILIDLTAPKTENEQQ